MQPMPHAPCPLALSEVEGMPNAQCPNKVKILLVDILPDLKVQGFWIQTATAGIARLISPSPTDFLASLLQYCTKKLS